MQVGRVRFFFFGGGGVGGVTRGQGQGLGNGGGFVLDRVQVCLRAGDLRGFLYVGQAYLSNSVVI